MAKKKRSVSKSPAKKGKKPPSETLVELIDFAPSKKTKGKFIINEKVLIPANLTQQIEEQAKGGSYDFVTLEYVERLVEQKYSKL